MTEAPDAEPGRGQKAHADLMPFDFSAIRPSADRARFDRTVSALATEMIAARSAASRGQSEVQRTAVTLIGWRRQIGLAAASVMLVAGSALLRTPRAEGSRVSSLPIAQDAGVPLRLAAWSEQNYRPTPVDLVAAFSNHLKSPLFR